MFEATGEYVTVVTTLAFRTAERLTSDLTAAGFGTPTVRGGWHGEPVTPASDVLVHADRL